MYTIYLFIFSLSLPLYVYLSTFISLAMSLYLSFFISLSLSLYLCLSIFLSPSLTLSLPLSLSLYLNHTPSPLCLTTPPSIYISTLNLHIYYSKEYMLYTRYILVTSQRLSQLYYYIYQVLIFIFTVHRYYTTYLVINY